MSGLTERTVLGYLALARGLIETGEPWYQPQEYALAAIGDCDEAIEAVRKDGLNDFTVGLASATILAASECTRSDTEENEVASFAADINRLWRANVKLA